MVVLVVELELQPDARSATASTNPKKIANKTLRFRRSPVPISPKPTIGSQSAYVRPCRSKPLVVVTRAVVEIANTLLCGPLLIFGIGLLVNVQFDPDGKPAPQANDTEFENPEPVGVTVIA